LLCVERTESTVLNVHFGLNRLKDWTVHIAEIRIAHTDVSLYQIKGNIRVSFSSTIHKINSAAYSCCKIWSVKWGLGDVQIAFNYIDILRLNSLIGKRLERRVVNDEISQFSYYHQAFKFGVNVLKRVVRQVRAVLNIQYRVIRVHAATLKCIALLKQAISYTNVRFIYISIPSNTLCVAWTNCVYKPAIQKLSVWGTQIKVSLRVICLIIHKDNFTEIKVRVANVKKVSSWVLLVGNQNLVAYEWNVWVADHRAKLAVPCRVPILSFVRTEHRIRVLSNWYVKSAENGRC